MKPQTQMRNCLYCGESFESQWTVQRFCKPSHRQRAFEQKQQGYKLPDEWADELESAADKRDITTQQFVEKSIRRVLDGEKTSR